MKSAESEQKRTFRIMLKDGKNVTIEAHSISKPNTSNPFYVLNVDNETIAAFTAEEVVGWRIIDK